MNFAITKHLSSCRTLSFALALGFASNAWAVKVGSVDLQKALLETKKGKAAKSQLEKEADGKRKKLETEQAKIQKMGEDFQKKSVVMSEKARQEKGMEVQQKMSAFQEMVRSTQMEMQGREAELMKPIIDGLKQSLPDLAKKKSVEMVFQASSVGPGGTALEPLLFAADKVDLTDDLIKAYDEKNPAAK